MEESGAGVDSKAGQITDFEGLKGRIMADIEAKLSQKEESLWKRGQVEIRRLQVEQQQAQISISKMQEEQEHLNMENQKIRGALLEVTSKFEHVVNEMREVLRALPQQPQRGAGEHLSPRTASTSASDEAAREETSFEQPSGLDSSMFTSAVWSTERVRSLQAQTPVTPTPVQMWHTRGDGLTDVPCFDVEDLAVESRTFCTPPRDSPDAEDPLQRHDAGVVIPPPPQSWHMPPVLPSPAPAVLSLATALPATPTPGKRLHLAEHIETQQGVMTPPTSARRGEAVGAALECAFQAATARAPELINLELTKEPGFVTLGMEVKQVDSFALRIERIDENGLVARHNIRQDLEKNRVQVGDRIIETNGIRHDPQKMLAECKVRQRLAFTLLRDIEGKDFDISNEEHPQVPAECPSKVSGSPLRPEAQEFVPSSQKECLPLPQGSDGYEAGEMQHMPLVADGKEEVKRALFP